MRHQQQMASLLGSDRPVHSRSLRRALLGERLVERVSVWQTGNDNSQQAKQHCRNMSSTALASNTVCCTRGAGLVPEVLLCLAVVKSCFFE